MVAKLPESAKIRIQAARMLEKGIPAVRIAEELGVARTSVQRWKKIIATHGIEALKVIPEAGRPGQLSEADLKWLSPALREGAAAHGFGTDLWTLKRVNELIRKRFGLNYSDVHVWRLLGKMGFSSQKPERQAKERDEEAVQLWRKKTWPKIKKKPKKKGV